MQQRSGHAPAGGIDTPGDSLEQHADQVADAVVAGRSAEPLLDELAPGAPTLGVQRETRKKDPRKTIDHYLEVHKDNVWRAVRAHFTSVHLPDPNPRLRWWHQEAALLKFLEGPGGDIASLSSIERLDWILHPTSAFAILTPIIPTDIMWSAEVGTAIAQELEIAVLASLRRLGTRYLAASDATGKQVTPDQLVTSAPVDRWVAPAMCANGAFVVEPGTSPVKGAAPRVRPVKVTWQPPPLWNWVRAEPADATAEEVAAALWHVDDSNEPASFNAYLLAAAPPLFGVPERFARKVPAANANAPSNAAPKSAADELATIAGSSLADEIALHQAPAINVESTEVIAAVDDCAAQLAFIVGALAPWGLGERIEPARRFIERKRGELATADAKKLVEWGRVIAGQRDRLREIGAAVHAISGAAGRLGDDATSGSLRELLEPYAQAAGTSHLASTSATKLDAARSLQTLFELRAVQATQRELAATDRQHRAQMDVNTAGIRGKQAADLTARSFAVQEQLIHGTADRDELEEVTLRSTELALRERLVLAISASLEIRRAAMAASSGLLAKMASLFSGKFRNLGEVAEEIGSRAAKLQADLGPEANPPAKTPEQRATDRNSRRAVVTKVQAGLAALSHDRDLGNFFDEAKDLIEDQQFRTVLVGAAVMVGISLASSGVGSLVTRSAGRALVAAEGVASLQQLSALSRFGMHAAGFATDVTLSSLGQAAVTGGPMGQTFAENIFMSLASTALFGGIARAEAKAAEREGRIPLTWATAATIGQKAAVAGKIGVGLTAHAIWGTAMASVASMVVSGHPPTPMKARDAMIQFASVALGRGIHAAIAGKLPGFRRLAAHPETAHLASTAEGLLAIADRVEKTQDPKAAAELLEDHDELLEDEIASINKLVARTGDATHELAGMRAEAQAQLASAHTAGMFETALHLEGMQEVIPGALWRGSKDQVRRAVAAARNRGARPVEDRAKKQWRVQVDGRDIVLQERGVSNEATLGIENRGEPYVNPYNDHTDMALPREHLGPRELLPFRKLNAVTSWKDLNKAFKAEESVAVGTQIKDLKRGLDLTQRLGQRDATALRELIGDVPAGIELEDREWTLVEVRKAYAIMAGRYGDVAIPAGVRAVAHNHPAPRPGHRTEGVEVKDLPATINNRPYAEILADPTAAREAGIIPSQADIHAISDGGDHVIFTRYRHTGDGKIANPGLGVNGPRVALHLKDTQVVQWNDRNHQYMFRTSVEVRDATEHVLWSGEMFVEWNAITKGGRFFTKRPPELDRPLRTGWRER